MSGQNPKRDAVELWRTLQEQALNDEIDDLVEMTDEEIDAEIRAAGGDPAKIRADGAAFVKGLLERRAREEEVAAKLAATERRLAERAARRGALSREELVARIEAARRDPRLEGKLAVGFRNRDTAAATIPELEAMLDEIEALLHDPS